ncbi:hypothetical protein K435DRAFT_936333 [Dendrothele bispora CBS 962.96]|uniref:Uncharacterized protein n=1 Tax=Dendrothele bispora (strain CBS 962.96) TaxID=1314807 RepID=A0A4S8MBU0_DENBC|nr:hypothetical protein K435DRAFT_936333 [Dendrothele bispora CBS 962.96]
MPRSRSLRTETAHLTTWAEMTRAQINSGHEPYSSFLHPASLTPDLCILGIKNPVSIINHTETVADPLMYCEIQPQASSNPLHHIHQASSSQSAVLPRLCNELDYIGLPHGSYPALAVHHPGPFYQNSTIYGEMDIAATGSIVSGMLLPTQDSLFGFSNAGEFSQPPGGTEADTSREYKTDGPTHYSNNTVASSVDPKSFLIMVEEFEENSNVEIHSELDASPDVQAQHQSLRVATDRLLMVSRQRRKHPAKYICKLPGCGQDFTASHNLRNIPTNMNSTYPNYYCVSSELCGQNQKTRIDYLGPFLDKIGLNRQSQSDTYNFDMDPIQEKYPPSD